MLCGEWWWVGTFQEIGLSCKEFLQNSEKTEMKVMSGLLSVDLLSQLFCLQVSLCLWVIVKHVKYIFFFWVSEYHKIYGWRKAQNIHQLLLKVHCWVRYSCEEVRIFTVYSLRKSMRKCVLHCSGPTKSLTSFISIILISNHKQIFLSHYELCLVTLTMIQNSCTKS